MTAAQFTERAPPQPPPPPPVPVLIGEIIPPTDRSIRVIAKLRPFSTDTIVREIAAGMTLEEILETMQPERLYWPGTHIFVDDWLTLPQHWSAIRPKPGHMVTISVTGCGGGKKNIFRLVLTLAVLAASIFVPPLLPGAGAFIVGSAAAGGITVGAAVGAAIFPAGRLLLSQRRVPRP